MNEGQVSYRQSVMSTLPMGTSPSLYSCYYGASSRTLALMPPQDSVHLNSVVFDYPDATHRSALNGFPCWDPPQSCCLTKLAAHVIYGAALAEYIVAWTMLLA